MCLCMCLCVRVCAYARPMLQEFFNGMMRMDDGTYRAKRPRIKFHTFLREEIPACRFRELAKLKGIPEDDVRSALWMKKVRRQPTHFPCAWQVNSGAVKPGSMRVCLHRYLGWQEHRLT